MEDEGVAGMTWVRFDAVPKSAEQARQWKRVPLSRCGVDRLPIGQQLWDVDLAPVAAAKRSGEELLETDECVGLSSLQ